MKGIINRSVSIYTNEGATVLFKEISKKLRYGLISVRGTYSLGIDGRSISFSAPNTTMVRRNLERFEWENAELTDFVNEIEDNDVVYDIGANTGLYTLFAATKCSNGEVIAFEPYPPNARLLKKDIDRNRLTNIEVIEKALSDSVGSIEFSQPSEADVGYGSSSIQAERSGSTIDVPTTTGNQLISSAEIPQPNVVKIDVEGAEPLVIEGLSEALSAPECRVVYCEVHLPGVSHRPSIEDFGTTVSDLRERLEGFGFTVEKLRTRDETELFFKAYRTEGKGPSRRS